MTEDTGQIHLWIDRGRKDRWLAISRQDGVRITDWIVERVCCLEDVELPTPAASSPQADLSPLRVRVTRAQRLDWIRKSKIARCKLADWIVARVEQSLNAAQPYPIRRN